MKSTSYLAILLTLAAIGCDSDPEPAQDDPTPDMTAPDQPIDAPDLPTDAPDQPADMAPDAGPDAGPDAASDAAPDQAACDQDAAAAPLIAVNTDVSAGAVTVTDGAAGERTAVIDASAGGAAMAATRSYLYLNLSTGAAVALSDQGAVAANTWHIAFKRAEVRTNSADSGPGALLVARVDDTTWEAAQPPNPAGGRWVTDDFVSDTCEVITYGRGSIQTAFGQWYDYDPVNHTLSAPDTTVFFLYDAITHAAFKLQITGYDSGVYTVRWAPLGARP
jgi:hypothetical protein